MRHSYFGKKLSRNAGERRRLLQSLARELVYHGEIKTTIAKAKAVQPMVEKLVTHAKKGGNANLLQIKKVLADKQALKQLLSDAESRFGSRASGFTRIVKLGPRPGDASEEALLTFVDAPIVPTEVIAPKKAVKAQKPVQKTKASLKLLAKNK